MGVFVCCPAAGLEPLACGHWDALSRSGAVKALRGYYVRGHVDPLDFVRACRRVWADTGPNFWAVKRGWLRFLPYYSREIHPQLGVLEYRGVRLTPARGPGRGAFPATWWWGDD